MPTDKPFAIAFYPICEYSGWFYISCPVIWKSLFISAFCAYRIIISVETLVKTATHRRCGKVLTNIPTEMDKSSSTKEAISEYRNSDFQFSGSAISSHKNIQSVTGGKYGVRLGGKIHNNYQSDNLSTPLLFHKENNTKGKT